MADANTSTADPFETATAAAVEDILAAIGADEQAGPEDGAAPGEAVGHRVIRLRDPASAPATSPDPGAGSAGAGPAVGHGTIRLRG
jgi:hypothetical protein